MKKNAGKRYDSIRAFRKFRINPLGSRIVIRKIRRQRNPLSLPNLKHAEAFNNLSVHFPDGAVVQLRFRKHRAASSTRVPQEDRYYLTEIKIGLEFVGLGAEAIRDIEKELTPISLPFLR